MAKKQTPSDYAKSLYMLDRCKGDLISIQDAALIHSRVNAFVDGARWQQRQARKRTVGKTESQR